MAIPKHDEIRVPVMELLTKNGTMKLRDFIEPLSEHFGLTDEEVNEMYPSGNGHIFYDRISWALSYLNMAGLLDKPKRGMYKINESGIELLKTPKKVDKYIEQQLEKREPTRQKKKTTEEQLTIDDSSSELTPQEKLYSSFSNIRKSVYTEILNTILTKTPTAFEKLVVLLLQKMGYGGEIENSGLVTKVSNDGGIDGIIKEDVLGLGRIHIQAKRYKIDSSIGREEIQKFVGALAVAQSNKGVFITTSYYSKGAIEYANNLNGSTTLVLIDGKQLAEYIYDYGLGMQVEQTIEIKKLDADFWDSMKDDE
ncbi:restriction endonuclease [Cellulophaga geojensis KL-A]|uniref:Restriction endonuclease n=2 Tax=Flavobacteriaceae TaxID=49546 RepID=A0A2T1NNH4_9FLAO|nr:MULTISPECIES: restriction endonuclease [Flavobacteriaceae]EWH09822.1 restriction endonuclease [Cellulophaga geojensis KL-A]MBB3125315.1 restriction system protein [Mesoflavibacter zeaxanthinifaciens subsp. sabulilitoris]PSG94424.1 restriction endonuclease [Mesoflavibacter zeaxanthinifaciens subsp. sabulilitoris]